MEAHPESVEARTGAMRITLEATQTDLRQRDLPRNRENSSRGIGDSFWRLWMLIQEAIETHPGAMKAQSKH